MNKYREILSIKARAPWWYLSCLVLLPFVLSIPVLLFFFDSRGASSGSIPQVQVESFIWPISADEMVVPFAIIVSSICLAISILILFVCTPIYLFSENLERSKKAGGLVKTTLGFIIASGTVVIGTLSFV